jgi:hypothetical protein
MCTDQKDSFFMELSLILPLLLLLLPVLRLLLLTLLLVLLLVLVLSQDVLEGVVDGVDSDDLLAVLQSELELAVDGLRQKMRKV